MYCRYDVMPRPDGAVADVVFSQLLDDFEADDIGWVMAAQWSGPVTVDLECIDFSGSDEWAASADEGKVDEFAEAIQEGHKKPIILIDEPDGSPLFVLDGHHRLLAYKKLGLPPVAYVGRVGGNMGPWLDLHSSEIDGKK